MATDGPRDFNEDVFPAELTEIYRRRWKLSRRKTADGTDAKIVSELPPLDAAEQALRQAHSKLWEAGAARSLSARIQRCLRIGKREPDKTEMEACRAEVDANRRELAQVGRPSVDRHRLIGLAFSGGGIRSATF